MGRIALVGGNEFRAGCEVMDRAVLAATGVAQPSVAIVPTAAAAQNPSMAAANGVSYFGLLGADAWPLMLLWSADADDPKNVSRLADADLVYLTGGDPGHLLKVLSGSKFLDCLKRMLSRGAVLAGSSAGAMIMGSWMGFPDWQPALGILPHVALLPHHEGSDPDRTLALLAGTILNGVVCIGVESGTACLSGTNGWTVVGEGSVILYSYDGWEQFESGVTLPIGAALSV